MVRSKLRRMAGRLLSAAPQTTMSTSTVPAPSAYASQAKDATTPLAANTAITPTSAP